MTASKSVPGARRMRDFGRAKLILGNSLAVLPHLRGTYDVIVSDPPYGIGYDPSGPTGSAWKDVDGIVGDQSPFDPCPLLRENLPTVLFGANHYASRLPDSSGWIVWDKRPGMRSMSFADCELAWSSLDRPARMIRYPWSGAARGPETGEHWHPTQKPLEVMRWIIESVSEPGAVILDPYMGSGTTGVAALQMDRKFVGIEVEERWFAAAERRIERELAQGRLF
jgi:site-specific DNA-methyltransferase (adenine-specific)